MDVFEATILSGGQSGVLERLPSSTSLLAVGGGQQPEAPVNIGVVGTGPGLVTIGWSSNEESDVDFYRIYRGTISGQLSRLDTQDGPAGPATIDYDDDTVIGGTEYFYAVTAVDTDGLESAKSSEVSATPPS